MTNKSLEEQGEELFNGKALEDITLDDVEEFKEAYYEGDPKISDEEYDEIIQKKFDGKDPTLGYDVEKSSGLRFEVKQHEIRMKGQDKILSWEEYLKWIDETDTFFGKKLEYLVQYKLDGLSLSLTYERGQLKEALLRGDGAQGENIINSAVSFKGVKKLIPYKDSRIYVRGEIVLTQEDFDRIPLEKKSNRRNVAAGVARRIDPELAPYLSFVVWGLEGDIEFDTESDKIKFLQNNLGFNVVKTIRSSQFTEEVYQDYGDKRDKLDLLIDGMVIKINDLSLRDQLDENPDTQHGQIALKFPAMRKASTLKRVEWLTGKTGKVAPTAVIEPIELLGSTIGRVTLCSLQEIERLDLQLNERVWIEKRGDVIPKIYAYDEEMATSNNQVPIEIPDRCPSCGSRLKRIGADLYCTNDNCKAKLAGRVEGLFKTLDIKGFGEIVCAQLVEFDRIKKLSDVFTINEDDLNIACGYKWDNAHNLISRIEERVKSGITLAELIQILQIPNIGASAGAKIQDVYDDIDELIFFAEQGEVNKFTKVLGEAAGLALYKGLLNMSDQIDDMLQVIKVVKPTKDDSAYHGAFCFTGFRDKDLAKQLDDLGYKELSSVTKACTLVVSKEMSLTGKLKKAQEKGIKVISLSQLKQMLADGSLV
jgi:DNA ligase (NAD+)